MKKFLLPLLVVATVSSAFAGNDSQLAAAEPQCISFNSPISFVARRAPSTRIKLKLA